MSNFINDEILIDFKMPKVLEEAVKRAEDADKENDFVSFVNYADNIDIMAKNCCADGAISKRMWDLLVLKYCIGKD